MDEKFKAIFSHTGATPQEIEAAYKLADAEITFIELTGFKIPRSSEEWSQPCPTHGRVPGLVLTADDINRLTQKLIEVSEKSTEELRVEVRAAQSDVDGLIKRARGEYPSWPAQDRDR